MSLGPHGLTPPKAGAARPCRPPARLADVAGQLLQSITSRLQDGEAGKQDSAAVLEPLCNEISRLKSRLRDSEAAARAAQAYGRRLEQVLGEERLKPLLAGEGCRAVFTDRETGGEAVLEVSPGGGVVRGCIRVDGAEAVVGAGEELRLQPPDVIAIPGTTLLARLPQGSAERAAAFDAVVRVAVAAGARHNLPVSCPADGSADGGDERMRLAQELVEARASATRAQRRADRLEAELAEVRRGMAELRLRSGDAAELSQLRARCAELQADHAGLRAAAASRSEERAAATEAQCPPGQNLAAARRRSQDLAEPREPSADDAHRESRRLADQARATLLEAELSQARSQHLSRLASGATWSEEMARRPAADSAARTSPGSRPAEVPVLQAESEGLSPPRRPSCDPAQPMPPIPNPPTPISPPASQLRRAASTVSAATAVSTQSARAAPAAAAAAAREAVERSAAEASAVESLLRLAD